MALLARHLRQQVEGVLEWDDDLFFIMTDQMKLILEREAKEVRRHG